MTNGTLDLGLEIIPGRGAEFSACRTYRYRLWRRWGAGPAVCFVMLNPSTADESRNDPTVERCERRARMLGFGGLVVVNLFAYRATLPSEMKRAADPFGPENNDHIILCAREAGMVVCAWGRDGAFLGSGASVRQMLETDGITCYALKLTCDGYPYHPLYVPYEVKPQPWADLELGTQP